MKHEIDLKIDVSKVQAQVTNAVLAEQKYWRENDAKLRAIEQRVPTYEDFRQMVLGSNLRPLDKGESLRDEKGQISTRKVWNSMAESSAGHGPQPTGDIENYEKTILRIRPKNSLEFMEIWSHIEKQCDNKSKLVFLENLGVDELQRIFKAEINGDLLGKFLVLFEGVIGGGEELRREVSDLVVGLLGVFPTCGRFGLNLMFLKESEMRAAKRCISFVENEYEGRFGVAVDGELLKLLKSSYA
jgi:hypothetical protein